MIEKCTGNVHLALKLYWQLQAALGHLVTPTKRGLPQITGVRRQAARHILLMCCCCVPVATRGAGWKVEGG